MTNVLKSPRAAIASPRIGARQLLPLRLLRRGWIAGGAAMALGLSGCSPLHMGMMGGMMGMGAMMRMEKHPVEPSQSCQALATTAQADVRQWSALAADSVRVLLPAHTRRVEAMLTHCAADTAGRAHETHAERATLASDIRADHDRMKQMGVDSLRVFLPEHAARLDRFAALSGAATPRAIQERHDDQRLSAAQRPRAGRQSPTR